MAITLPHAIILSTAFIVGLITFVIGAFIRKKTVELLGASLCVAVLIAFFVESQEIRVILVSFATVTAVIISMFNIIEMRKIRRDSSDKEERDRKERLLNEIIDWARNTMTCGLDWGKQSEFEKTANNIELYKKSLFVYINDLKHLNRDGIYIKYLIMADWNGLDKKVKKVRSAIGRLVKSVDTCLANIGDATKIEEADTHRNTMNETAEAIIKEANRIKIKLIEEP